MITCLDVVIPRLRRAVTTLFAGPCLRTRVGPLEPGSRPAFVFFWVVVLFPGLLLAPSDTARGSPLDEPARLDQKLRALESLMGDDVSAAARELEENLRTLQAPALRLQFLLRLTPAFFKGNDPAVGLRHAEEALTLAYELNDVRAQVQATTLKVRGMNAAGRWSEALPVATSNVARARTDPLLHAELPPALVVLALIHRRLGRADLALPLLEECLERARANHDQWTQATAYNQYGLISLAQDRLADAREHFARAQELYRALGDHMSATSVGINYGTVLSLEGRYRESNEQYTRVLELKQRAGEQVNVALVLAWIADNHLHLKDYATAIALAESSLAVQRTHAIRIHLALALCVRGNARLGLGQSTLAETDLLDALRESNLSQDPEEISRVRFSLAGLYERRGDFARAYEHYREGTTARAQYRADKSGLLLADWEKRLAAERREREMDRYAQRAAEQKVELEKMALNRRIAWTAIAGIFAACLVTGVAWAKERRKMAFLQTANQQIARQQRLLENEMAGRASADATARQSRQALVDLSRDIGRAQVATSTVHLLGNVLNTARTAVASIRDLTLHSPRRRLAELLTLVESHQNEFGSFFAEHSRGRYALDYFRALTRQDAEVRRRLLDHVRALEGSLLGIMEVIQRYHSRLAVTSLHQHSLPADLLNRAILDVEPLSQRAQVKIARVLDPCPPVWVDPYLVLDILHALLRTAIRRSISATEAVVITQLHVRPATIAIEIHDRGPAMDDPSLQRIFQMNGPTVIPGATRDFSLHLAWFLSQRLGGRLEARHRPGHDGLVLALLLPRSTAGLDEQVSPRSGVEKNNVLPTPQSAGR